MTQEVEVLVKMTFEVGADIPTDHIRSELNGWIDESLSLMDDGAKDFSFINSDIIYLKEESEIYGNR